MQIQMELSKVLKEMTEQKNKKNKKNRLSGVSILKLLSWVGRNSYLPWKNMDAWVILLPESQ
ncbi:MAG: hypothetical protein AYK19_15900 [Theionarchaea archaeon DG-70-1]|nr:MAG: hypothetical protein AYK19_15900 [Theionarchaea archaeon DG-70-1]